MNRHLAIRIGDILRWVLRWEVAGVFVYALWMGIGFGWVSDGDAVTAGLFMGLWVLVIGLVGLYVRERRAPDLG